MYFNYLNTVFSQFLIPFVTENCLKKGRKLRKECIIFIHLVKPNKLGFIKVRLKINFKENIDF